MATSVLRWGLVSAGRISHDFAICLRSLKRSGHEIVAVADKVPKKAEQFASVHGVPKFYENFSQIAVNPSIDIAYIGTLNPDHFASAKMMLEAGKHVLVEKPMCTNLDHVNQLLDLAKSSKKFLMEGIWSRCFPAYYHLRNLLNDKVIGEPNLIQISFGSPMTNFARITQRELGGSVTLDVGIYAAQLATLVYKGLKPVNIKATGILNDTGVDDVAMVVIDFGNGKMANIVLSSRCQLYNSAVIAGPTKHIRILPPFHYPTIVESPAGPAEFPLPETVASDFNQSGPGLIYEAEEVKRCIDEGLLESPCLTHNESRDVAYILQEIRKQIGVKFYP